MKSNPYKTVQQIIKKSRKAIFINTGPRFLLYNFRDSRIYIHFICRMSRGQNQSHITVSQLSVYLSQCLNAMPQAYTAVQFHHPVSEVLANLISKLPSKSTLSGNQIMSSLDQPASINSRFSSVDDNHTRSLTATGRLDD